MNKCNWMYEKYIILSAVYMYMNSYYLLQDGRSFKRFPFFYSGGDTHEGMLQVRSCTVSNCNSLSVCLIFLYCELSQGWSSVHLI